MTLPKKEIRTRFAPSPTGFLHLGGARTALFAWAYARHHGGRFVLRIEDTDLERSTPEAVQAILEGMEWLGLVPDEGPFYQTHRMARYKAILDEMLRQGTAYRCWCSTERLEELRQKQEQAGLKPRYDRHCRPPQGAASLQTVRTGPHVIRYRTPLTGSISWDDLVKGPTVFDNQELDDLVIARSDGSPTYNFCVVVDDWEMGITHVLRGDDHVNNTPRQINLLSSLGACIPIYGHFSMILGEDGEKFSKRHGAVSLLEYRNAGYLPEAMLSYLARLGWSHGDQECFSREEIIQHFDGTHISQSPSQFDSKKLMWVGQQFLKCQEDGVLATKLRLLFAQEMDFSAAEVDLPAACGLMKDRCATLQELYAAVKIFFTPPSPEETTVKAPDLDQQTRVLLHSTLQSVDWKAAAIESAIESVRQARGLRMPLLAIPVRRRVFGVDKGPAVAKMLSVIPKAVALQRLESA